MRKILLFIVALAFCLNKMEGQTETKKPEATYMTCLYSLLPDSGIEFESTIYEAEALLVRRKVLEDDSGESYLALFEKLKSLPKSKMKNLGVEKYFMKMIMMRIDTMSSNCNHEGKKISKEIKEKMSKFNKLTSSIKEDNIEEHLKIANEIRSFMKPEDFELDFYKFMTFLMLETYPTMRLGNSDIVSKSSKFDTDEMIQVLPVKITANNKFSLRNKVIPKGKVLNKIKKHIEKYKSQSRISLRAEGETLMETITDFQEELKQVLKVVRNELSLKKFNLPFDKLTGNQQEEIKKAYPDKIL